MRFERLNDNKLRITLSYEDLLKEDVDFHSIMSNSIESQSLFLNMLDKAEREMGFSTKDYLIKVEALALVGGDFVFTVTRSLPKKINKFSKAKPSVHIKSKNNEMDSLNIIYCFNDFDDFLAFIQFYEKNFKTANLGKKITLYEYNGVFYLSINNINCAFPDLKRFFSCITEFAKPINNSLLFESKLIENGSVIMKHNAISIGIKNFIKRF